MPRGKDGQGHGGKKPGGLRHRTRRVAGAADWNWNVLAVTIDPEVAGDVEMLQDMVMAAFNEAGKKVEQESKQKMGGMLGGMGLPPGLL